MISQVLRLSKLQLINLFGINEFRHTKDSSKRKRYMMLAIIWTLVAFMVAAYTGVMSFGFIKLGVGTVVPMYIYTLASLFILIFTFFKAGSVLFSMKSYEMIVSLPVSKASIIISRFITMYVSNLLLAMLLMLPAVVVYGVLEMPGIWFYVMCLVGIIFVPLLPLTVASIIGAGITAISVRTKHKSVVQTVLSILLLVVFMAGSTSMSDMGNDASLDLLKDMAVIMEREIGNVYPPALWFSHAVDGQWSYVLGFVVMPFVIFVAFAVILQKYFHKICMGLNAVASKNNYKLEKLSTSGVLKALWKRELKRYFASSIYVTNTMVGYVLAVLAMVAIFFMGTEKIIEILGISGAEEIIGGALPFIIAILMSITSMTSCSISMEGKTFWRIQTLPVRSRDVYLSKIIANLTVAAPFYIASVIFACLTIKPDIMEYIWIIIIPALYLIFMAVAGITINLAFPIFNWDNEVHVVKQSASTFVSMVVGMVSCIVPAVFIVLFGASGADLVRAVTVVVLLVGIVVLYGRNGKKGIL